MAMLLVRTGECCAKRRGVEHPLHFVFPFSLCKCQIQNTAELSAEHSAGVANLFSLSNLRLVLEILPSATFSSILKPYLPATAATALAPNFVLKYSAFITSRGLITKKGYVLFYRLCSLFVVCFRVASAQRKQQENKSLFRTGWHHFTQLFVFSTGPRRVWDRSIFERTNNTN